MKGLGVFAAVWLVAIVALAQGPGPRHGRHGQGERLPRRAAGATIEERFEHLDADGDGAISRDEWPGRNFVFNRLDANDNGSLDLQELKDAGKRMVQRLARRAFAGMDKNRNGTISFDEWDGKPEAFEKIDADDNKAITPDELRQAWQQMTPQERRQYVRRLLWRMDVDNDGAISKEEWKGRPAVFDRLDANGDGTLTPEEVRQRARRARPSDEPGPRRRGRGGESRGW